MIFENLRLRSFSCPWRPKQHYIFHDIIKLTIKAEPLILWGKDTEKGDHLASFYKVTFCWSRFESKIVTLHHETHVFN